LDHRDVAAVSERPGISIEEWYPLIVSLAPTPRTVIRSGMDLMPLAYGPEGDPNGALEHEFDALCEWVGASAAEVGGFPLFLRTGLTSGKHGWRDTCYVPDAGSVESHVSAIIEYSASADFMGLPCDVWAVRELLPTYGLFTAFDGMPVTRERRYFVRDGTVIGHHPYWPPEALERETDPFFDPDGIVPTHRASIDDWRSALDVVNAETPDEIAELTRLTERVGAVLPGAWSVDWLWVHRPATNDSGWYLTDMAWAERSFVWDDYPTAPHLSEVPA